MGNVIEQKPPEISLYCETDIKAFAIPSNLLPYCVIRTFTSSTMFDQSKNKGDFNAVMIVQTDSINSDKVKKLINLLCDICPLVQPFIIFIIRDIEESLDEFYELLKEKELDKRNFFIKPNEEKELGCLLMRLIKYHNQLDDNFSFDKKDINYSQNQSSFCSDQLLWDEKEYQFEKYSSSPLTLESINQNHFIKTNRMNFFVIGRTGTGKSTLINQLFGEKITKESQGNQMTSKILKFDLPGKILTFYDTPGFTLQNINAQINYFKPYFNQIKQHTFKIHGVLILINAQSRTILNNDMLLIKEFTQLKLPIFFILNKCFSAKDSKNHKEYLVNDIQQLFKDEKLLGNLHEIVYPVNLIPEEEIKRSCGMIEMLYSLQHFYAKYEKEFKIIKELDSIQTKRAYCLNNSLLNGLNLNNDELSNVDELMKLYRISAEQLGELAHSLSLNYPINTSK